MSRKEQAEATIDTLATRVHKLRLTAESWKEIADLMKDREREALAALDAANRQVAELRTALDVERSSHDVTRQGQDGARKERDRLCTELRTVKAWLETRTKERDQQHRAAQDWENKWRMLNEECLTLRANVEPMQKALQKFKTENDELVRRINEMGLDHSELLDQLRAELDATTDTLRQAEAARDELVKELRGSTQEHKALASEVDSLRAKLASKTIESGR